MFVDYSDYTDFSNDIIDDRNERDIRTTQENTRGRYGWNEREAKDDP
jgi:hypothetical protein